MDVLDLLAREGVIAPSDVAMLRKRGGSAIAAVIDAGLAGDDVVADLLAREAGAVVIDLDRGTLEHEAVRLVPEEISRRHLAIVVALEPSGRSVRAAFANPLDERAIADIAAAAGRGVRAMVATVSSIRRALDREYGPDATRVIEAPAGTDDEIAPESTRRVATGRRRATEPPEEVPRTMPVHRLEQEATIEQRHEALLLALIEKGVITRAEYGDALKRLLSRR
ncbi:hypothetical protein [Sandaracinus amylolyticus]|uniref:Type IV fimbrial assembly, ATPase PilB n=1 Tax=Sandaracinus amylolyticus TaxID=927083 RepID=A0A0F6YJ93_9BACT|nr:hypothetical protein [Sandaracinus amylolyticus]AKF07553.1 Type IV fimbrial assembly, ATPase PilB [Sandaracinus amylolyticus]